MHQDRRNSLNQWNQHPTTPTNKWNQSSSIHSNRPPVAIIFECIDFPTDPKDFDLIDLSNLYHASPSNISLFASKFLKFRIAY
jgi:hypothetical protein